MHLVVLLTNPEGRVVRIETERFDNRAHGARINPSSLSLKEIPLTWKEHIFHGQPLQQEINPREWAVGRRIKSERHETSSFLLTSESARFVIETADGRMDWTRS